jgi:hypothetical protein
MSVLKCIVYGEKYEKLLRRNAGSVDQAVGLVFSLRYFSRNKAPVYGPVVLAGYYKIWLRTAYWLLLSFN